MRSAALISLFFVFLFPLKAQQINAIMPEAEQELHSCAHARSNTSRSGTYPQNELLWSYDVKYYGLDVEVDPNVNAIKGSVNILAVVTEELLGTFVLELLNNMQVDSIIMDDEILEFIHQGDELLIELPWTIQEGTWVNLTVYYQGSPESSGFFSGFSIGQTPYNKPVLWTLSEPLNARQWWPVKQVLEDKADSVMVRITTPNPFKAASNGLLIEVSNPTENSTAYTWKSNYPIAYYLVSLAVSEYAEYNFYTALGDEQEEMLVQNFIYNDPSYLIAQQENIDRTGDFLQIFSNLFGTYPFAQEKYGHANAPMGGGMEHQTMTTLSSFGADLVAHELAHQWFGDQVTCATWSDIWINEGFASYGEYLAREYLYDQSTAQTWLNSAYQNVLSAPDGSVYVPPLETNDVWRIFNGRLSYKKGAAILHMLRNEINDDPLFFEVLQIYREAFADSVATGDDFQMIAEQVTGKNWAYFFDQWYYGEGYPIFDIFWWTSNDTLYLRSIQQGSAAYPTFFKTSLEVRLQTTGLSPKLRFFQDQPDQTFTAYVGQPVLGLTFDPDAWLLKKSSVLQKVEEIAGNRVSVFPNPVRQKFNLYIENPEPGGTYRIFDTNGRLLQQGEIKGMNTEVSLTPQTGGNIYLLEVFSKIGREPVWVKLIRLD
ncbi:MAG: M1 family aminopeptidase [Bacteroides sp.]|jgi:aminopeptidase N|nr:M1 family aminopeptidase [Bacteroides sp.]